MADEIEYKLEDVKATPVASSDIDQTFRSGCIDLISSALGGRVLGSSDEWFAAASNLIKPTAPIRQPGKMVYTGAWYDGWETRRHNPEPFDWVIIRLGVASGTVEGVEVDTFAFNGNHAPFISVEGCFRPDDNDDGAGDQEVLSWGGTRGGWETILGIQECGPSQRFAWKLDDRPARSSASPPSPSSPSSSGGRFTHVRLNMYPDGGIARFRLFGHAVPVFPSDEAAELDLAAAQNGGVAVSCSDQHFGTKDNLILPGRGVDMGDGWETARSREKGHVDWAIIRLGAPGFVKRLVVDTAHFRGNYPQRVKVDAIRWKGEGGEPPATAEGWREVVEPSKAGPDQEHEFVSGIQDQPFTHVKLTMIPDGGVKRIRVFAQRAV
ncbi:Allantoicase [Cytospora paraplurivora]|uniref:allantoicase n=1 Tax=Cytospora paraplurivora TaxID=2898453 RepID=A0AAN9UHI7_9PEZI